MNAQVDARESLALWLRSGRAMKKLSLEEVAKITKIQARILEKLERGELDGLPADVFVKGFVRSFAKCVGLDESEALVRYGACKSSLTAAATPTAKALVESMGLSRKAQGTPATPTPVVAAPVVAAPVVEPTVEPVVEPVVEQVTAPVAEVIAPVIVDVAPMIEAPLQLPSEELVVAPPVAEPKKKRSRKKSPTSGAPRSRKKKNAAVETVVEAAPATNEIAPPANGIGIAKTDVADIDDDAHTMQVVKISLDTGPVAKVDAESLTTSAIEAKTDDVVTSATTIDASSDGSVEEPRLAEGSQRISASKIDVVVPDLEAADSTATEIEVSESHASGTWQPTMPPIASTPSVPWRRPHITASRAYVVPTLVIDDADPDSADREREDRAAHSKDASRLSFLPPILLDREDRSARQGGLTLAVIILLIAATLTLSYLMRRPSPTGDGVTMLDGSAELLS